MQAQQLRLRVCGARQYVTHACQFCRCPPLRKAPTIAIPSLYLVQAQANREKKSEKINTFQANRA
jgi:hypothetical protein